MKFYPPENEPVQVSLTSGHIAIVDAGGTKLEARFHREAIARGCLPEGVEREKLDESKGFDKMSSIIEAMHKMVDDANEEEFTNDGKPKTDAVSKRVGFTVAREERDTAWEAVAEDGA